MNYSGLNSWSSQTQSPATSSADAVTSAFATSPTGWTDPNAICSKFFLLFTNYFSTFRDAAGAVNTVVGALAVARALMF